MHIYEMLVISMFMVGGSQMWDKKKILETNFEIKKEGDNIVINIWWMMMIKILWICLLSDIVPFISPLKVK